MLRGIWHTSWTVENLERSIAFYCDDLGFEVIARRERTGDFIETVVGFRPAHLKIAALRLPLAPEVASGHQLELIEYVEPRGVKLPLATCNVGAAHLALQTDDIHGLHRRLSAKGVVFVSPPVEIPSSANAGGYACYLRDPDGFTLELVQPAPAARPAS